MLERGVKGGVERVPFAHAPPFTTLTVEEGFPYAAT
jgi:hypothetical protein